MHASFEHNYSKKDKVILGIIIIVNHSVTGLGVKIHCMQCNCFWGNYLWMASRRWCYHKGTSSVVYLGIIGYFSLSITGYFSLSITRHPLLSRSTSDWSDLGVCLVVSCFPWQPRRRPSFSTRVSDWSSQRFQTVLLLPSLGLPQDYYFPEEPCRRATYTVPAAHLHWAQLHLPAFVLCFSCGVGIMQLLTLIGFIDCILPRDCQLDDIGMLARLGPVVWSQGGHCNLWG